MREHERKQARSEAKRAGTLGGVASPDCAGQISFGILESIDGRPAPESFESDRASGGRGSSKRPDGFDAADC